MATWTNPIDYQVGQATCVARFNEQVLTNIDFAGSHTHSGSTGDGVLISGSSITGVGGGQQEAYEYITLSPVFSVCPKNNVALTLFSNCPVVGGTSANFNFGLGSGSTASMMLEHSMNSGTWSIQVYYETFYSPIASAIDFIMDGITIGTFKPDDGTNIVNRLSNASTFNMSSCGLHSLKILMSNASGANSAKVGIQCIELRRLSA